MQCELCQLVAGNIKTRLYYKNDVCTIVDCSTCSIPMVVLNHHGAADEHEKRLMMNAINTLFSYESIRTEQRKIPAIGPDAHIHWHIEGAKYIGS